MPKFPKNTSPAMYKKSSSFKMKGSPMQRNFGISPIKQNVLKPHKDIKPDKPNVKQTENKKTKRTNFNVSNPPKVKQSKHTLRPISGFEADFPKTKRLVDHVKNVFNPTTHVQNFKKISKETGKAVRQGLNYFKAR